MNDDKALIQKHLKWSPAYLVGQAIKTVGNIVKAPLSVVWKNNKLSWPVKTGMILGTIPLWGAGKVINLAGSAIVKTQEVLLKTTLEKIRQRDRRA